MLNLGLELPLAVLDVLVALHSVCLTGSCLTIGENRRVISVYDLADHTFDPNLLVERPLVGRPIAHLVELVLLWLLVPCIKLEENAIASAIDLHLARRVG